MNLQQRMNAFVKLGKKLEQNTFHFISKNEWFTKENITYAVLSIINNLKKENFDKWLTPYLLNHQNTTPKKIGVVMAGNIPLVGFHDFLCVLITGNIFIGKISSKDNELLSRVANLLVEISPAFKPYIFFTEAHFNNIDAIIATGSNNTARYFEYYFKKYPSIIRKNRNSIAILDGSETKTELSLLGEDIFRYFGLGCRNVSKLFIPSDYDFNHFFSAIQIYNEIIFNNKYANNYHYNKTIYCMQKISFLDNGFLLLSENKGLSSPIGTLYYEYYKDNDNVILNNIINNDNTIQCIVSKNHIPFGKTQQPELWDYADNVDTIVFLTQI